MVVKVDNVGFYYGWLNRQVKGQDGLSPGQSAALDKCIPRMFHSYRASPEKFILGYHVGGQTVRIFVQYSNGQKTAGVLCPAGPTGQSS